MSPFGSLPQVKNKTCLKPPPRKLWTIISTFVISVYPWITSPLDQDAWLPWYIYLHLNHKFKPQLYKCIGKYTVNSSHGNPSWDHPASRAATNTSGFSIWSIAIKAMERRASPISLVGLGRVPASGVLGGGASNRVAQRHMTNKQIGEDLRTLPNHLRFFSIQPWNIHMEDKYWRKLEDDFPDFTWVILGSSS